VTFYDDLAANDTAYISGSLVLGTGVTGVLVNTDPLEVVFDEILT
jgi:hypothetical protein